MGMVQRTKPTENMIKIILTVRNIKAVNSQSHIPSRSLGHSNYTVYDHHGSSSDDYRSISHKITIKATGTFVII